MPSRKQMRLKDEASKLADPQTWEYFFKIISAGENTRAAADFIGLSTNKINGYIKGHPELSERYEEARQLRAEFHAERIEKIANDVETGEMDAAAARVSLDARKFLASRFNPDRWGDKQRVDLTVTDMNALYMDALEALSIPEGEIVREGPPLIDS